MNPAEDALWQRAKAGDPEAIRQFQIRLNREMAMRGLPTIAIDETTDEETVAPESKRSLREFVTKYEMLWHASTVALYVVALVLVVVLFPDVSNLWVSIFVLVGSATAAIAGMIAALKTKDPAPPHQGE